MFLVSRNIGIDTKIMIFELIVTELSAHIGFGGHLGRHLEKNAFPGLGFMSIFSMLKSTPKPIRIR